MKYLKLLFTALLLLCTTVATAHDFEVGGIYYNITDATNKTVEVTYKAGCSYAGCVVIPESVTYNDDTYSVTSIGNTAFYECTELTSIVIPNSVTSIGNLAFDECIGLTSIVIPNSVTDIGTAAFQECSGLTSIVIGNKVKSIGNSAFSGCSSLTSIVIPNSVTSIGEYAFQKCSGLTSIVIGNSVTSIGFYAFRDCSGLTAVYINDLSAWCNIDFTDFCSNPTSYAKNLYLNGELITKLVIPDNVTEIKNYAFRICSALTSVEIPNSVTSIGDKAFQYCNRLTSIEIPNSVKSIGEYAFDYCLNLTSVVIGNSIKSIGKDAFGECPELTSVHISNLSAWCNIDFSSYYSNPLYYAKNLYLNGDIVTDLVIPNNVTEIKDYAFYNCPTLTSVVIPNSVTSIGYDAFCDCSGLTSVVIGNSVTSIGRYAFYNCYKLKTVVNLSSLTITKDYSGGNGFIGNNTDRIINVPNSSIDGDFIFDVTDGVNTLVWYIGNDTQIILPDNYKGKSYIIGANAFYNNTSITSIEIPNSVTSIGYDAFRGCSGLTSIEIPNSVTSIGYDAFYNCSGLKTVINLSSLTITKGSSGNGYVGRYADKVINAPNGTIEGDFVFGVIDDVNTLAGYIGNGTVVVLPENYKGGNYVIAADVFKDNTSITSVIIGNNISNISTSAFKNCTALTTVIFDAERVKDFFKDNTIITNITFTNRVKAIESNAFAGMNNLTNIILETGVPPVLSNDAFTELHYKKIDMFVPEGFIKAYKAADVWKNFLNIQEMEYTGTTYTLTFMLDGDVYATYALAPGAEMPLLEEPTKEGYTFNGWSLDEYMSDLGYPVMPERDIIIEGRFTVNYYTVTYIVDGETFATKDVAYGSEIALIEEPAKEGYTFNGWSEVPETMPAEDITVEGTFEVNTYVITYLVDGEVFATDSVAYGSEITLIEEPTKEGYIFSGWSEVPYTMPAEDITVEGTFTKTETSIEDVEIKKENFEIYNLKGERIINIKELPKGIYIINGKKILVK